MNVTPTDGAPADATVDLIGIIAFDDALTDADGPIAALDPALAGTLRRTFIEESFEKMSEAEPA